MSHQSLAEHHLPDSDRASPIRISGSHDFLDANVLIDQLCFNIGPYLLALGKKGCETLSVRTVDD